MQFIDLLPREHILVPLEAATLAEASAALLGALGAAGAVDEPAAVEQWLLERRPGEVVNLVPGVALPHYRTDQVDRLTVALGVSPRPLGGEPAARIVALILAPHEAATLYLQTVAALARLFRDETVARAMLAARAPEDILAIPQLRELRLAPRLTVRDIMIHSLDGVPPDFGVRDAVDLMIRKRLRAMPVVGEKREVLGIISEWDVMRGLLPQIPRAGDDDKPRPESSSLKVRDVMTRSVLCVSEDMALEEAAHLMINKDVEQFPVVREGKLTGFLTRGDIIRKLFGR
jgi:CBS domain-containing protein/mannitol/fructose-specific phosphotransferase system IIA component (Ntr-type)